MFIFGCSTTVMFRKTRYTLLTANSSRCPASPNIWPVQDRPCACTCAYLSQSFPNGWFLGAHWVSIKSTRMIHGTWYDRFSLLCRGSFSQDTILKRALLRSPNGAQSRPRASRWRSLTRALCYCSGWKDQKQRNHVKGCDMNYPAQARADVKHRSQW